MQPMYYIGLDVHKRKISYCVKDGSGRIHAEGSISATRLDLDHWMRSLPQPWSAAMEATMFTGWIYDHLKPHAAALKVAHPLMLRAIAAAKKKNDRIDASKICDCLRCDFLPESYMASTAIRERRRTLRYRNLLVRQMVQMKIKISALLMEAKDRPLRCATAADVDDGRSLSTDPGAQSGESRCASTAVAPASAGADAYTDHESAAGVGHERGLSLEGKALQRTGASAVRETRVSSLGQSPPARVVGVAAGVPERRRDELGYSRCCRTF